MDDLMITCNEIAICHKQRTKQSYNEETKIIPAYFNEKKSNL